MDNTVQRKRDGGVPYTEHEENNQFLVRTVEIQLQLRACDKMFYLNDLLLKIEADCTMRLACSLLVVVESPQKYI